MLNISREFGFASEVTMRFALSQRTVIRASAACAGLLVVAQALWWRQARQTYRLSAGRRALGDGEHRPAGSATASTEVPSSRHELQSRRHALPQLPGWNGRQSQLSGVCLGAVCVASYFAMYILMCLVFLCPPAS